MSDTVTTDTEAMAAAGFAEFHFLNNRVRSWEHQPDEDSGTELGRNTFRAVMKAALGVRIGTPMARHSVATTVGASMSATEAAEQERRARATPDAILAALEANTKAMNAFAAAHAAPEPSPSLVTSAGAPLATSKAADTQTP